MTPQEITSPMPTVNIINGIGSGTPYAYRSTKGTMILFEIIGGSGASYSLFLRSK